MAYRDKEIQRTGKHVEAQAYLDLTTAQLALHSLQSEGVPGFVIEAASFNPLLAGAAGGHRLMVDEADLERASSILRRAEEPTETVDEEPEGTTRCPNCELPYCRYRFHVASLRKMWRCDKCDHVWSDAKAGPRAATSIEPGDPKPVFLLWKGQGGVGAFVGLFAGVLAFVVIPHAWIFPFVAAAVGWFIGKNFGKNVCSDPTCRNVLTARSETCSKCGGSVAGKISHVAEHYAMVADFRRTVAEQRKKDLARAKERPQLPKKKKSKQAAASS